MNTGLKILTIAAVFLMAGSVLTISCEDTDASDLEDYHIYMTIIDENDSITYEGWISFDSEENITAYAKAANAAVHSTLSKAGISFANDISLSESGWWSGPENYWTASFCEDDGEWELCEDPASEYVDSDSAGVFLTHSSVYYKHFYLESLPAGADAKNYLFHNDPYMGDGYHQLPSAGPCSYEKNLGGNTIWIIIAVIIVIIIVIAAIVLLRKKKNN